MTGVARSKPKANEWTAEFIAGSGWHVIDPEGVQGELAYATRNAALTARGIARAQAARLARCRERACISCQGKFQSEGPHHRMCGTCRHRGSAEASPTGYSFGAMNGRRK